MDPFIGEIRIFTGNFAPSGWFLCQGQLFPISAYQALFAIIGTFYGGNGTTNFQLPNLQGRFPIGVGTSPSGQTYDIGEVGGAEQVTLTLSSLPTHSHLATFAPGTSQPTVNVSMQAGSGAGHDPDPQWKLHLQRHGQRGTTDGIFAPAGSAGTLGNVAGVSATVSGGFGGTVTVQTTGNGLPIQTVSPYLGITYIIAYNGVFPSRG